MSVTTPRRFVCTVLLLTMAAQLAAAEPRSLVEGFKDPPASARPWVYWFWLNGNITREGITADLEAMAETGVGGVLIMEVDQGVPVGPVPFMSDAWRTLFHHVVAEADRLGLEVNMNNDAGWNGSGGPWIKPEESMQKVVWTETEVQLTAGQPVDVVLPQPETVAGYYRDIDVLAFPTPGKQRIGDLAAKTRGTTGSIRPVLGQSVQEEARVEREAVLHVGHLMQAGGRLAWDGDGRTGPYTLLRLGHTSTGVQNHPAPASGRGLECDKLGKTGIEANYAGMMGKLIADNGSFAGGALAATHIDSWENGSQNWTDGIQDEFERRRGYDMMPYLPAYAGFIVDSPDVSERFLRDLRQTISELVLENYAGHMKTLANKHGLRFTVEAYGGPCDSLPYAGRSDEPMCEFWIGGGAMQTCKWMSSAAHAYGKTIVGAEAFTAADQERWLEHPASIKSLGDRAFCDGVNRFVFHRYAMQPWLDRKPGMTMGPWGIHYERTQTWWRSTGPWHAYLARCQYMLRQGRFVADLCYLTPESQINAYPTPELRGYDYGLVPPEVVMTRMSVKNGWLTLPGGMQYRLLVLPEDRLMTPPLLAKIRDLVHDGATVVGEPPTQSPSLTDYPACDASVKRLVTELWGDCDGVTMTERAFGQGRVFRGRSPEEVLRAMEVTRDFDTSGRLDYIHRATKHEDIYFVANPDPQGRAGACTFRVFGKQAEIWRPETGEIEFAPLWSASDAGTTLHLFLGPSESVFVVFRDVAPQSDPAIALTRNGETVAETVLSKPVIEVKEATYGVPGDPARQRDVRDIIAKRLADERYTLPVSELAQTGDPANGTVKTLRVLLDVDGEPVRLEARDGEAVHLDYTGPRFKVLSATYGVPGDAVRTRNVREKLQHLLDSGRDTFRVAEMAKGDDPAFMVVKTLDVVYELDGKRLALHGVDSDTLTLYMPAGDHPVASLKRWGEHLFLETEAPGDYRITFASGKTNEISFLDAPQSLPVDGPWTVQFPEGWGAPPKVTMAALTPWNRHEDAGVRHFSGTGTYGANFDVPAALKERGRRLYLDLGEVAIMARVTLNGRDLGLIWKPPFRLDVTDTIKTGRNTLEIAVTNLWVNRMIGDAHLPEDSERNPNGTLKAWPAWLQEGKPSPTGRHTFTTWRLWDQSAVLQPSGLLGPVTIQSVRVVPLH